MTQWKDISSAPKDGTLIWLARDGEIHIGFFDPPRAWDDPDKERWILKTVFRENNSGLDLAMMHHICKEGEEPTAWMPLPPAPDTMG